MIYDVRPMPPLDGDALAGLLNHTIALGGSTSYEAAFTPEGFLTEFLMSQAVHSARVAWAKDGLAGFQTLCHLPNDPPALSIATFADLRAPRPGVGRALFAATRAAAHVHGAPYIRAVIRSDNMSGLRFYRGRGFRDVAVHKAVPLADGTLVDRIETRLILA